MYDDLNITERCLNIKSRVITLHTLVIFSKENNTINTYTLFTPVTRTVMGCSCLHDETKHIYTQPHTCVYNFIPEQISKC